MEQGFLDVGREGAGRSDHAQLYLQRRRRVRFLKAHDGTQGGVADDHALMGDQAVLAAVGVLHQVGRVVPDAQACDPPGVGALHARVGFQRRPVVPDHAHEHFLGQVDAGGHAADQLLALGRHGGVHGALKHQVAHLL